MFCKFCGREINENSVFCPYCGNIVGEEKKDVQEAIIVDAFKETSEFNNITKIFAIISGIIAVVSFLPYNIYIPFIGAVCALIISVCNIVFFCKNKSKYHLFLIILDFVLLMTNITSIVLYSILK